MNISLRQRPPIGAKLALTHLIWAAVACVAVSPLISQLNLSDLAIPNEPSPVTSSESARETAVQDQKSYNDELTENGVKQFTEEIAANPNDADAYMERGWAYSQLERNVEAVQDLSKAIAINPKSSDAYCKRAWIYNTMGLNQKAVQDATVAIKLDPQNWDAYDARAQAYSCTGHKRDAEHDGEKSLRLQLK